MEIVYKSKVKDQEAQCSRVIARIRSEAEKQGVKLPKKLSVFGNLLDNTVYITCSNNAMAELVKQVIRNYSGIQLINK